MLPRQEQAGQEGHFPTHQLGSPALRKEQNSHRWIAISKAQGRKVVGMF